MRLSIGTLLGVCVLSPYLAYKAWDLHTAFARIPEPLHSSWIEYRREVEFGLGFLPGDNETGFVIYRLTDTSAHWARSQGENLRDQLPGGSANWHPTPVGRVGDLRSWVGQCDEAEACQGSTEQPTFASYLDKYGFSIPLDDGVNAEADHVIQSEGSFYSYGRGGAVTIVDPNRGKVYFAYAG